MKSVFQKIVICFILSFSWTISYVVAQCNVDETQVRIYISPDQYPGEISWTLATSIGDILLTGSSMGDSICVDTSTCLNFTIRDSAGDGICCGFGMGNYELYYGDALVVSGGDYGDFESSLMGCEVGYSCFNVDTISSGVYSAPFSDYWYLFIPEVTASYSISTCDMNDCNTILFVYDHCELFPDGDSNVATTFYNDDDCGEQSRITGALEAGQEYYIRIGDKDVDCGSDSIRFEIINNGPIMGCTDTLACNYNPLASVDDGSCQFEGPGCPNGSDLIVSQSELLNSLNLTTIENQDQCTVDEGCLGGFNQRDIIRFTTYIENIGDEDFYVGRPAEDNPLYSYDNCHGHWHYRGYAEYLLYDDQGVELPIGFKNGFCVIDLDCSAGGSAKYSCSNQGITAGCADYYDAYLSCQWIDITDVTPGNYTFVVRVNWTRSADALGKFESNYSNNWAQVCIEIGRDLNDNPTLNVNNDCPALTDCLGEIYGSAQPDCKGDCNGPAIRGDLNDSGNIEHIDAMIYTSGIVDGSLSEVNTCNDLNGDGALHVSDVAKLAACLYFGENSQDVDAPNEPCVFGDQVHNPMEETLFSIVDNNQVESYFDIGLYNATTFVLAYELNVSGATILNVENLITSGEYNAVPSFSVGGNKVLSVSFSHQSILKKLEMEPILRVYYSAGEEQDICIEIQEVVNTDYHTVEHNVESGCFTNLVSNTVQQELNAAIKVWPNPAMDVVQISIDNNYGRVDQILIRNVDGQLYQKVTSINESGMSIDIKSWPSGIYFYEIVGEKKAYGRIVKL